ncbi:MAG: trypsin-like peptidase domain-containing protein [Planctomycetia bacterium]|nr:trypsin-like peptidase domain-containing protein [Planctomycetia bacterium]
MMNKPLFSHMIAGMAGGIATLFVLWYTCSPMVNDSSQRVIAQSTQTAVGTGLPVTATGTNGFVPTLDKETNPLILQRFSEFLPEEQAAILVYEHRNKSVVNIETVFTRQQNMFFREEGEGRGSGVVLNNEGIILTNYHVVEKADSISVTLFNGLAYKARLLGQDAKTDIALLKIEAPPASLFPVAFGDSSQLLVGQIVYAIGNPFGNERTMTRGIVSNLNRTISSPQQYRQIKGVVQIDAAINPGNSGGPLFDTRGRMIGMNTAIASRVGENSGVGFAVPVNTIQRIVTSLLETGKVVRGDAGIVQVTETEAGLIPSLIDENGAADRAGLQGQRVVVMMSRQTGEKTARISRPREMDIIIGVNGQRTRTGEEFIMAIEEHKPGETVQLNIIRRGQKMDLPVVLD